MNERLYPVVTQLAYVVGQLDEEGADVPSWAYAALEDVGMDLRAARVGMGDSGDTSERDTTTDHDDRSHT